MLLAHTRTGLGRNVGERTLTDLRMLYQGAVRQVDASIGRLLDALSAERLDQETAIVLAGDHGEEFQEHGHLAHYPKLYDELIHVPLVVSVPGVEGRRVERQVGLDAIPPTVADLLGVESPPAWSGRSLAPGVRIGAPPVDEPVISVAVRGEEVTTQPIPRSLSGGALLVSARDREWTYVRNVDAGTDELYRRSSDPEQRDSLPTTATEERRTVVERFRSAIEEHVATLGEAAERRDTDVDEDLEARLAALGYR
jgi:arylsulfatase A-like enzyme